MMRDMAWLIFLLLLFNNGQCDNKDDLCPSSCVCQPEEVVCRDAGLVAVPSELAVLPVRRMDLGYNNITEIPRDAFFGFTLLEELNLAGNSIHFVDPSAFMDIPLRMLSLEKNNLAEIPWRAIRVLSNLHTLHLASNNLFELGPEVFDSLSTLKQLRLDGNYFQHVPSQALANLVHLEALNLASNKISVVGPEAFRNLTNLVILVLERNNLQTIHEDGFVGLTSLKVLEINDNRLEEMPVAITKLPSLEELTVAGNRISYVPGGLLQKSPHLSLIELKGNPIRRVDYKAFCHLPKLKKLILSEARELRQFPDLNGTSSLEILRIDRSSLTNVPSYLCQFCKKLKSLDLKSNKLTEMPNLSSCRDLRLLDLSHNRIQSLEGTPFNSLSQLQDLLIGHNLVKYIPQDSFVGLTRLQVLDVSSNEIVEIHEDAFLPLKQLEDLNVGFNLFPELPSQGLDNLLQLKTFNNPHLREFPGPDDFPRVQKLVLSYAYHCCQFLSVAEAVPDQQHGERRLEDSVLFPTGDFDINLWNMNATDIWPEFQNLTSKFGKIAEDLWDNFGSDISYPANLPAVVEEYFDSARPTPHGAQWPKGQIQCIPQPGPFMPCQDLFDWWTLRCGVWIVFLLAMLGNGTVVFVLVFSRSKMDVPRFLVCNLAMADFFMGIYLGFLAVVDASTLGEFRKYAIPWQMSAGCQIAGFLGVLSSELSVYTLAVITLERNYAITHAMHLNKRLSLKHAAYIMSIGWLFAGFTALLPLLGISDYRKFAVCLPFEIGDSLSLGYVLFLMFINGVAFLILMGCYLKMYCAIRGSQAWNSNDSRIAKRMALLVFTDFICWAPIAFFSLTSTFGLHLISLEEAKVFTVFILPLNSCCNPFLYAILTKQFKKDCVLICKAIEESRVTRGIGRCRHSSNFSNQKTPANTNSLVDKTNSSNKEGPQQCSCNKKHDLTPSGATPVSKVPARWSWKNVTNFLCFRQEDPTEVMNEYAYQIAEIQQKQHQKHKRNSSVSSENFSSSRSDSWRQANCASIPLKLLEHRRRNSWTVTRKPSQDSNMSSSRNDSSATTASTSTWRMSRSSVSSDVSNNKPQPAAAAVIAAKQQQQPNGQQPLPAPILRQGSGILNPPKPAAAPIVTQPKPRVVVPLPSSILTSPKAAPRPVVPTLDASPPKIAAGRAKPRLIRQSAIQEDNYMPIKSVSFEGTSPPMGLVPPRKNSCPVHAAERMATFYKQLDSVSDTDTDDSDAQSSRPRHSKLAVGGFVPRKLSTISSKSSITRESSGHLNLLESLDINAEGAVPRRYCSSMSKSLTNVSHVSPQAAPKCPSDNVLSETRNNDGGDTTDDDDVFVAARQSRRYSLQPKPSEVVATRRERIPLISPKASGDTPKQPML